MLSRWAIAATQVVNVSVVFGANQILLRLRIQCCFGHKCGVAMLLLDVIRGAGNVATVSQPFMTHRTLRTVTFAVILLAFGIGPRIHAESSPPLITSLTGSNQTRNLTFTLTPGIESYTIQTSTNLSDGFTADPNFFLTLHSQTNFSTNLVSGTNVIATNIQTSWLWRRTNAFAPQGFFQVQATPLTSNALLAATVLNRLTYGPTPDEIERINNIGPDSYIAEQLAPWSLVEDVTDTHTNLAHIETLFRTATEPVYDTNARLSDLRAWHTLRAVGAKRQLLEILLQFFENHFVTEYDKSRNWFAGKYDDSDLENTLAAHMEHRENAYWRATLLNPQGTFYELLKISAESPAMIIYLDTVSSRGDGSRIANENFARELLELFTFGVDNGYDQTDITIMSRCWTGWTLELFDPVNAFNPFAAKTTNQISNVDTNFAADAYPNLEGVWSLWYRTNWHNTSTKNLFTNKFVPARFGAPWTTKTYGTNTTPGLYQLVVPGGRSGTNGMAEGYEVIQHLANLPFTQEYISIKLCRLFVHDDFPNPSSDPASPEYQFYNYAGGNLSPEAALVQACMLAWETNSPKGQIWKVLETIFASDLFRTHAAAQQKIKTPLEFTVSAIRALRSSTNGSNLHGTFTSWTDGYALATPLNRMGGMLLFDREAPDGYPEAGPPWISAGTLAERIRWVQSFCITNTYSGHSGSQSGTGNDAQNSMCDPVALVTTKLAPESWNHAGTIADYFLGILYPGEGAGNLAFARIAAIDYLNHGSADTSATHRNTLFANLPITHRTYGERIRGMAALLMSMQRFHEQ
jgi:uncharacterized protein (DUF1800 family)